MKNLELKFKQTDIGLIPDDWETIEFESTLSGNDFSRKNLLNSSEIKIEGLYPVIDQGQDYIAGYTDLAEKVYKVNEPVILFGDHTRIFKYIDFSFVGGADGIKIFSPNKDLFDPNYFYFALSQLNIPSRGYNRHYKLLKERKITKPPLPEQKKIAHILSNIQEAIETQEQIIKTTQELKKALMQKLFTEGLNGESQKQTEIGFIPESWKVKKIGEITKIQTGGTPSRNNPIYWNGDIPWVKTGEVNYDIILNTEEKITLAGLNNSATRIAPKDTLLVAMYGQGITRGRVAILGIEAAFNQACAALFPDEDTVLTKYLFLFLTYNYEYLRSLGHGANQRNLNTNLIKSVSCPIPSLGEQKIIVDSIWAVDEKLKSYSLKIKILKDLFSSSLNSLMTGQIRVKDIEFKLEEMEYS